MAMIKCKMCGGDLAIQPRATICECEYCGSKQTIPNTDDEKRLKLYERANKLRFSCEFDKAAGVYESIVAEFQDEAEAYWGLILCKYGIEYVDDPKTGKKIPTCHRSSFDCVLDENNFELVMENADAISRAVYREEAKQIEELRKGIVEVSSKEEPYDIFICFKETDVNGERTIDSVIAQDVYDELTEAGYRVFFSRITLEEKLGQEYEPYIFAALNSAKVMLAFGTQYEYYNAVWVKNEWSRFLQLMEQGQKKTLIPCYKGIDAYDMPKEFAKLQAQDMGKVGAIQDLVRGIKKIIPKVEPSVFTKESVVFGSGNNVTPLLERAFMTLEDGDWKKADDFCEQVLNQDPKNAQAYLGKLMAELKVCQQADLANCARPFDGSNNYQKAIHFGEDSLSTTLRGYIDHINERNENDRLTGIYNGAVSAMKVAKTESAYKSVAETLQSISGFKDSEALAERCQERAEVCRKDDIYTSARLQMSKYTASGYEEAIKFFSTISDWKDADEQIFICQRKIEEIKAKDEVDRLEKERQEEEMRIAAERVAMKRKKTVIIITAIVIACIAFVILLKMIIIPQYKLNEVRKIIDSGIESYVTYGTYEQDHNSADGKEDIEWIPLDIEGKRILLISRYALDCHQYNTLRAHVTWENSSIRKWLNEVFLNEAFSGDEQSKIPSVIVDAQKNPNSIAIPGNSTTDRVFLLSLTEVNEYFSSDSARQCQSTVHCNAQGVYNANNGNCWWWLRSPGEYDVDASYVDDDGTIDYSGENVDHSGGAVRPAIWIDIEADYRINRVEK